MSWLVDILYCPLKPYSASMTVLVSILDNSLQLTQIR